jgi:hypothetical protein
MFCLHTSVSKEEEHELIGQINGDSSTYFARFNFVSSFM